MAIIETFGLTRTFGKITAVNNLTLKVEEGEVLGFLGPNGAGKTTTIRMLSAMIAATGGYAVLNGFRTDRDADRIHGIIGLLTESPGFYGRMTALENLRFFAGFYPGINIAGQCQKYLEIMGLWEKRDQKVGTYSKGMKQRLALARALLHEPKILFLDEPTAGLDPEAAGEVRALIQRLGQEGRTVFLSTHNLNEAETLCHHVAVVRNRLLAVDSVDMLRQRFFRSITVVELAAIEESVIEAVRKLGFVRGVKSEANRLLVDVADPEGDRPELVSAIVQAGGKVLGVSQKQHPLEEVYLKLIREESGNGSAAS